VGTTTWLVGLQKPSTRPRSSRFVLFCLIEVFLFHRQRLAGFYGDDCTCGKRKNWRPLRCHVVESFQLDRRSPTLLTVVLPLCVYPGMSTVQSTVYRHLMQIMCKVSVRFQYSCHAKHGSKLGDDDDQSPRFDALTRGIPPQNHTFG